MASSTEVLSKEEFRKWLDTKLTQAGLDSEVYVDYISGTLDVATAEDEPANNDDIKSQLLDILDGIITETDCADFCEDIIQKWLTSSTTSLPTSSHRPMKSKSTTTTKPLQLNEHITTHTTSKERPRPGGEGEGRGEREGRGEGEGRGSGLSKDEKKLLITQYGSCYDSADEEESDQHRNGSDSILTANTNKISVTAAIKERREEERRAHVEKKESAKANQRLQQQKQQERKEKEKQRTQKRERKR